MIRFGDFKLLGIFVFTWHRSALLWYFKINWNNVVVLFSIHYRFLFLQKQLSKPRSIIEDNELLFVIVKVYTMILRESHDHESLAYPVNY